MNALHILCQIPFGGKIIHNTFAHESPTIKKNVFGLDFINPVGLGAGFDKNALYMPEIAALGFGFAEIGTVTPLPQPGNDQPRLFRLLQDKALINRMGFNNDGAKQIRHRMEQWRHRNPDSSFIVGGNIGKNKITPNETAWKDYTISFSELFGTVDYFTVNVSSPNTPGLRELQEKSNLEKIFSELQNINQSKKHPKPILLKIAPDLNKEQLDDIISLALEININGIVATNTTISRQGLITDPEIVKSIGNGGLSGKPVRARSTEIVQYLCDQLKEKIPVIASGGIFTGADAKEKLSAGAELIQLWTGFIYQGPGIAGNICRELA